MVSLPGVVFMLKSDTIPLSRNRRSKELVGGLENEGRILTAAN